MDSREVVVRFRTKLGDSYVVPEEDMVIPASLQRYGLSEVVNKLLGRETPLPFDFLVENKFIRSSLQEWLAAEKKTAEQTIEVEYVLAAPPVETSPKDAGEDWISRVLALGGETAVSTSYDGHLRLHDGLTTKAVQISSAALTALGGDNERLIIGAADGQVYFADAKGSVLGVGEHHKEGVDAACLSADGSTAATGGWDNVVALWNCDDIKAATSKKRQRPQSAAGILEGHTGAISCAKFGPAVAKHTLFTTSLDNTIKIWDTTVGSCVNTWSTGKHALSFCYGPGSCVAMSHEDGRITLWDMRTELGLQVEHKTSLRPHKRMCPQVVWAKQDANTLASISHDGTVKLLDPRSLDMPLQTMCLKSEDDNDQLDVKGLCVDFMDDHGHSLLSGASDGKVRVHRLRR
eukprot:GEMP01040465.1.p1 GENE.GEMP01040465.1~~GEMP01040465.1.p1  ORF type:complete len:405 (+),score=99.34 GEMP01040465.1:55-1269(+)